MADIASSQFGGEFASAHFVAFASPNITNANGILNIGFENDLVYKAVSGYNSFFSSLDNLVLATPEYMGGKRVVVVTGSKSACVARGPAPQVFAMQPLRWPALISRELQQSLLAAGRQYRPWLSNADDTCGAAAPVRPECRCLLRSVSIARVYESGPL